MALRLLHTLLQGEDEGALNEALEDVHLIEQWTDRQEDRLHAHLLVEAERSEDILDHLKDRFGGQEGFRVFVMDVQAAHPRPGGSADQDGKEDEGGDRAPRDVGRVSYDELYEEVVTRLRSPVLYVLIMGLSAVIAAAGFQKDSVAVLIGAMVIAPLLGPNVSLALATTLADPRLAMRGGLFLLGATLLPIAVGAAAGLLFTIDPQASELLARTDVGPPDVILALAAGAAGALAFTTRLSPALVGVTVSVALLPPVVAVGIFAAVGAWPLAAEAATLYLVTIVGINLTAVVTLWLQGVRPRLHWQEDEARRATIVAVVVWVVLLTILAWLTVTI